MLQRVALLVAVSVTGTANADEFADGFSDPALTGWTRADEVEWTVEGGVLTSPPAGGVTGMLLAPVRESAASIRVDVMLPAEGRRNASVAFGMQPDGTGYAVRWYDQRRWLELLRFDSGAVVRVGGNHWQAASPEGSAPQTPGEWHVMAVDVVGTRVRAKVWPKDGDEPDWQLVADCPEAASGACGIGVDETVARFDNFVALTGEHVADLLREEREAQLALRRRARSIGLQEEAPHEALLTAQFTATGQTPAADLIFMAADESTHYFARADADGVHIGKVMRGHETILATQTRRWHDGPGDYRLEVLVTESSRDDRGQAWFINRAQVPPMVRVRARVGGGRGWAVSVHDDPIIPGKVGERYWDLDPIANSSAQRPFGARVGWRRAAGVRWTNLEVADRTASHAPKTTVTPVQRIDTGDRGGCWVALGDLDGDERLDYLVARNTDQRITALTAYANAGHELWRWGEGGGEDIAYDIPCIIYDIDHDGAAEVLISIAGYVLVLSGDTGEEERRHALPEGLSVADCIIIANLRGLAEPADIIIKTRYDKAWAYTDGWEPLWEFEGNTGHHPDVE
ncbi:MAG TPA: hypothetical protein QGH10_05565, partial [Armatimonadota bacterium]|nr:hypothetical protein [Armatimonadota bacterium]